LKLSHLWGVGFYCQHLSGQDLRIAGTSCVELIVSIAPRAVGLQLNDFYPTVGLLARPEISLSAIQSGIRFFWKYRISSLWKYGDSFGNQVFRLFRFTARRLLSNGRVVIA
jgi:hypothetical protein